MRYGTRVPRVCEGGGAREKNGTHAVGLPSSEESGKVPSPLFTEAQELLVSQSPLELSLRQVSHFFPLFKV